MAIYRTDKSKDKFTSISTNIFNDNRLSSKAMGLMGYLLSNPDNYVLNIADIQRHCKNKKTAIKSTINELIKFGYIEKVNDEYIIYEIPKRSDGNGNI